MNNSRTLEGGGSLQGIIEVPGDKSISHRALILGSIAEGQTTISGFLNSEDPISTANCLRNLGVKITDIVDGETFEVIGRGLEGYEEPKEILNCGNSGTTMRLIMGLLAGQKDKNFILTGDNSLIERPMGRVCKPLRMMGGKLFGREGAVSYTHLTLPTNC